MPAPPTDAPFLLRVLAVAPGMVLAAVAAAIEIGWLRERPGHWLLGRPKRLGIAVLVLLGLGLLAPYMLYGIQTGR